MKPRVFVPAIASGVLLWLAFFPCDLGPLGFVALVPWLTLVRAPVSGWRRYLAAYLGGFTFFALATQWVRVAHPMMYGSWLGLAVVMPLFWLAALAVLRKLDALKLPLAVSVPVAWVAFEFFRMHFPTGFTFMKHVGAYQMIGFGWYFLGYTQHAFTPLIQIADVGGVYAVSFVVGAVNGAVAELVLRLCARPAPQPVSGSAGASFPSWKKVGGGLAFALALLGVGLGYGGWRLNHAPFGEGPKVSAVQGNLTQDDKMDDPNGLLQSYSDLHYQAIQYDRTENRFYGDPPDLVVWPETCCPVDWCDVAPGASLGDSVPGFQRHRVNSQDWFLNRQWGTNVLFGLNGLEWDGARVWKYNSALLVKPLARDPLWKPGDPQIAFSAAAGRYDKMHLVPFGEYVPLGDELPFMKRFTPYTHDYACRPGERWTRFPLAARDGRKFTFGCLICYEDSDPYLARQYAASEPVDFLVNISNDGWFKGTEEHEQHLAICRFRAIEARRAVVRSVNMGISGFIDSDGRIVKLPTDRWSDSKKVDAIVTAVVPIDARGSLYAQFGDWVPAGCWLIALVGVAAGLVRRKVV
ncbi:Apolipoprotein N-acyltransferase [Gemmata obscuriglobus]|uniref:Apolipoprotein N-acyltransferase n=1 Tax=Gemmata obscuriglobus TaxID=114 RepID=A0A2Z3H500_9BACT|nr:apolipoprotein N-acyltransferase [Gemmata obscuriglobus]AWM41879.1 apolipoprotein N-acyltransferase [Gemmata obscuriglobus]QEG32150.1 Apolipoprotein N-acyltransferase [Gemmata obscuriglobus]VTS11503.1 apolipoprotein n-acyltransferase : Apolipoprotein N-acyltransferase OS=Planctomyces maris DSM 8797 GN=lnt PE=3 SV=1: CN_hydrolase [Gemmata obscuriglobus UQM 2246]